MTLLSLEIVLAVCLILDICRPISGLYEAFACMKELKDLRILICKPIGKDIAINNYEVDEAVS